MRNNTSTKNVVSERMFSSPGVIWKCEIRHREPGQRDLASRTSPLGSGTTSHRPELVRQWTAKKRDVERAKLYEKWTSQSARACIPRGELAVKQTQVECLHLLSELGMPRMREERRSESEPIQTRKVCEEVAKLIRDRILTKLEPGDKLPTVREVA